MKDYRVGIEEMYLRSLFSAFDSNQSGTITYMDLFRTIHGTLNQSRKDIVAMAFNKINGGEPAETARIKGLFNARNHPDVRFGRKTEDEVLGEFLETFESHLSLIGHKGNLITQEEFEEYYEVVSATIEDDKVFEKIMYCVWQLGEENSQSRQLTITQTAPFGTTDAPTDYNPWQRKKAGKALLEEAKGIFPAGYPSWPKSDRPKTVQEPRPVAIESPLIKQFKQGMLSRGRRGVFSLQRIFKVFN